MFHINESVIGSEHNQPFIDVSIIAPECNLSIPTIIILHGFPDMTPCLNAPQAETLVCPLFMYRALPQS
jgi:hypothetical protein